MKKQIDLFKSGSLGRAVGFLDHHLGILFLLPGLSILGIILVYPLMFNIYLSFTNAHLLYPDTRFVGLKNYVQLFTSEEFLSAAKRSVIWTMGVLALQVPLGLATALLLKTSSRRNMVFRSLLIIPYVLPPITVAVMWRWMLNSLYGVVNFLLIGVGILDMPFPWLSNINTAFPTVIVIATWFGFPLLTIAFLAGLQSIPVSHYEVAAIEGASPLQTFWYVTLPGIKTIVTIMILLRIIWVFNSFDILFLLTGGGPIGSTETLPILAYYTGWKSFLIGKTAAIATTLFVILFVFMVFYLKSSRKEETV